VPPPLNPVLRAPTHRVARLSLHGALCAAVVPQDVVLHNLVSAAPGSLLRRLGDWVARLDNASHVLVWSKSRAVPGEACEVSMVELPRLKALFVPRLDSDGVVRLYRFGGVQGACASILVLGQRGLLRAHGFLAPPVSDPVPASAARCPAAPTCRPHPAPHPLSMEHAGLYVSDVRSRALEQQLQGIPQAVVLENAFRQQYLFVPNMKLKRAQIPDQPLNTELTLQRSAEWEAAVKTRFFLYPLHPSGAFLQPPSLAATLYLVALRMLHREYPVTSRLISTCATDVPFTDDELVGVGP
jgi:hypothetical protein